MMKAIVISFAGLALLLAGCGDSGSEDEGALPSSGPVAEAVAAEVNTSPVGIWERRYSDAVGQQYHEVLEFKEGGTYAKQATGWMADRGRYSVDGNVISFRSDVDQRHSRDVTFTITGNTLTTEYSNPAFGAQAQMFKQVESWTRSAEVPNFRTVEIDGRKVPRGLPQAMMAALASRATPWEADALPTWIRLEENNSGNYDVTLHFYSPSMVEEMRLQVSPYDVKQSTNDGSRTATAPLPPEFIDLAQAVKVAKDDGMKGRLKKADVRVYKGYGAVWAVSTNAEGRYVSAETGHIIHEDVTGYIAQYNADWDRIHKLWEQALKRLMPKPTVSFNTGGWDSGSSYTHGHYDDPSSSTPSYDNGSQGSWSAGDWDAYNRFQSGTPNGDDCYRYGC